jgi:putative phosphoesterase
LYQIGSLNDLHGVGKIMKLGIISDIHCNVYGLQQALAAMEAVDEVLCLGDSINEARFCNETIAALKARGAYMILGNHEEAFLSSADERTGEDNGIDRALLAWLAGQPLRRTLKVAEKTVLMVHSTPWEPRGEYVFPHSPRLERFAGADADFVLYGHTHVPVVRRVGRVLVINPGSAGEARYDGSNWQVSCAILDTASGEVERIGFPDPRYA